jgi:hypothetical protein
VVRPLGGLDVEQDRALRLVVTGIRVDRDERDVTLGHLGDALDAALALGAVERRDLDRVAAPDDVGAGEQEPLVDEEAGPVRAPVRGRDQRRAVPQDLLEAVELVV